MVRLRRHRHAAGAATGIGEKCLQIDRQFPNSENDPGDANLIIDTLNGNPAFEPGAFAEGAVALNLFTGGGQCGNVFYGDVITRPSRSRSSDLKDQLGPFIPKLGEVVPNAEMSPN